MNQRPEPSSTTTKPSPISTALTLASTSPTMSPPPLPSPTTIALTIMLAQRHPFNSFTLRPLTSSNINGITLPPPHVFGQPTPLPPPAPKSHLRLHRMADRAFSQYTRKRKTVFPNLYKEDLWRLGGYCKNLATYTDRASWDFSRVMPKPVPFKSAWTGTQPKREKEMKSDMGHNGCDESEEADQEDWETETEECRTEDEGDDEDEAASSDDNVDDDEGETPRGRSPTLRRCTNGLLRGGYGGTRESYNQRKVCAAAVILRYWRAGRGLHEWRDFRESVVVCQRLWRDRITARGSLGRRRIVAEERVFEGTGGTE